MSSFQLAPSLGLWFFPELRLSTCAGLKHTQNALLLPLWLSALVLRLHSSEVAFEGVSLAFAWGLGLKINL